jgi:hypothetical protein
MLRVAMAGALITLAAPLSAQPSPRSVPAPGTLRDGRHDFERLHGTWRASHSRMDRPLSGTVVWAGIGPGFSGRLVVRPLAGGPAIVAEQEATLPDSTPFREASLILYDSATKQWAIQRTNVETGVTLPPLTGHFVEERGGVLQGSFLGQQQFAGRTILVRHSWRLAGLNSASWSQAYSADGGQTWERNWTSDFSRVADTTRTQREETAGQVQRNPIEGEAPPVVYCCPALELRRYAVPKDRSATLIELFEHENVLARQAGGPPLPVSDHSMPWMENVALFRDIDRPDVYTWLRGFGQMDETRTNAFYYGSIWTRHQDIVRRAGITFDDAHVVSPPTFTSGFVLSQRRTAPIEEAEAGLLVATLYTLPLTHAGGFDNFFHHLIMPRVFAAGGRAVASFSTYLNLLDAPGFEAVFKPKLIPGTQTFIWFAKFADVVAYQKYTASLERDREWRDKVLPTLQPLLAEPTQVWRLVPVRQWRAML